MFDKERIFRQEKMNSVQLSFTGLPTLAGLKMSRRKILVGMEERGMVVGESRELEASINFQYAGRRP